MKLFIEYAINKWIKCDTYDRPKMRIDGNGKSIWEPLFVKFKNENDTHAILETMPLSVIIRTLDEDGVECEKLLIFNIDFIENNGQYLKFKFGGAIVN